MNGIKHWLGSHWMGGVSGLLVLLSLTLIARPWFGASQAPFQEAVVPPLKRQEIEPQVVEHLEEMELNSRRIIDDPTATPQQKGRAWGALGQIYVTYSLWEQGAAACANATRLDPNDFQWPYLLAESCRHLPDLPAALKAMQEAQERMRRDAAARPIDHLAAACFLAEVAAKQGEMELATRSLEDALRIQPKCVFALVMRGRLASEAERHAEAISDLEAAVRLQPQSKEIRTLLSAAHRRQGNLEQAQRWTVTSTDKDRSPVRAPNPIVGSLQKESRSSHRSGQIASLWMDQGRFRSAAAELTVALQRAPDNALFLEKRAICFEMLERFADAKQDLDRLRELKPDFEPARSQWLLVCARIPTEQDQALAEARAWTAEDPKNASAWHALARCLMGKEQYAEAVPAFEQAIALEAGWPLRRLHLIECLGHLEQFDRMEQELRSLVEEYPHELRIQLTWARFLACGPREERRDPRQALEVIAREMKDRGTATMLECQAAAHHTLGETAAARQAIDKALEVAGREATPEIQRRMVALQRAIATGIPFVESWPFAAAAK
ncbi:MAG: tetratricopeptide repeat protein [Planctomycetaceae bacterium]|jgi:tetratricopeptide (TPR) repeat protein